MSSFKQKNYEACKETVKYDPCTGNKIAISWNILQGNPDVGLKRQIIFCSLYKSSWRL